MFIDNSLVLCCSNLNDNIMFLTVAVIVLPSIALNISITKH